MANAIKDVAGALLEKWSKDIWDNVMNRKYGDATDAVNAILQAIREAARQITHDLTKEIVGQEFVKACDTMDEFTETYLRALKDKQKDPNHPRLEELRTQFNHVATGVSPVLRRLDSVLMGTAGLTKPLLKILLEEWTPQLEDGSQHNKTVYWYLRTIDTFMAAQVFRQMTGLALLIFADNAGEERAKEFTDKVRGKIAQQLGYIYSLWPPLIQYMKKDYLTPMDPDQWYTFEYYGQSTKAMKGNTNSGVETVRIEPGKAELAWKFSPALDHVDGTYPHFHQGWCYTTNAHAGILSVKQYDKVTFGICTFGGPDDYKSPQAIWAKIYPYDAFGGGPCFNFSIPSDRMPGLWLDKLFVRIQRTSF